MPASRHCVVLGAMMVAVIQISHASLEAQAPPTILGEITARVFAGATLAA
ncbi:MAG: hypothetical protein QF681_07760 [Vicinamibacterales bacterium]|nr:hypothetical protein [Vicinamibacterales bacterium]